MVQRINDTEMKTSTDAAMALKHEASKGIGTPLERRIADALLENANNMDEHSKAIEGLTMKNAQILELSVKVIEEAKNVTASAEKALTKAEHLTYDCVSAVEFGSYQAVQKAMDAELQSFRKEVQQAASEAQKAIEQAQDAAREWKFRASRQGWFHSLTTIGKLIAITCVLFCTFICIYTGWQSLQFI